MVHYRKPNWTPQPRADLARIFVSAVTSGAIGLALRVGRSVTIVAAVGPVHGPSRLAGKETGEGAQTIYVKH